MPVIGEYCKCGAEFKWNFPADGSLAEGREAKLAWEATHHGEGHSY